MIKFVELPLTGKRINLQMFAEDPAPETGAEETQPETTQGLKPETDTQNVPKYTDADVDRLIGQKFAEWSKKQERKTSEAERLGRMSAEEKAAERMKNLEDRIAEYERKETQTAMTRQARAILQDAGVNVGDELISNLIAEDADSTKASVDSFVKLFKDAVDKAVKDAIKGETPKAGAPSKGYTKAEIMAVKNRTERQRLINENQHLFIQ